MSKTKKLSQYKMKTDSLYYRLYDKRMKRRCVFVCSDVSVCAECVFLWLFAAAPAVIPHAAVSSGIPACLSLQHHDDFAARPSQRGADLHQFSAEQLEWNRGRHLLSGPAVTVPWNSHWHLGLFSYITQNHLPTLTSYFYLERAMQQCFYPFSPCRSLYTHCSKRSGSKAPTPVPHPPHTRPTPAPVFIFLTNSWLDISLINE